MTIERPSLPSAHTSAGLAAALVACLASAAVLRAQPQAAQQAEPAQAPPEVLPPVTVEVVRLDVVVSEKRGRPRPGLKKEDFLVLEDGKPQEIVQFQSFARPAPPAPAAATPAAPETPAPGETPPEEQPPARYVVLAIDDVHMEMEGIVRARKALARFLREDLRPEDQVALVTTSGAQALSQEFTTDRGELAQVLARLSPKSRRAEWMMVPYISDYQAEMIEAGDPMALDTAVQDIMTALLFQDQGSAEQEARRRAHEIVTEAVYNTRLTLEALEALCRGLSGLTGRKAVFLVSDGFLTGMTANTGMEFDVRRIVDAATRAGVAIYSLDTRGLVASPPGASASSLARVQPTTLGAVEEMRRRSDNAVLDAMNALAADTGGFLVESRNDLRSGLREMLKDTETYYVLAYESTNTRRDGGFRKIVVRTPGVQGVKLRTRSGYFAPDDRRLYVATAAEAQARRSQQRRAEMQIALGALAPLSGIPVRLSADYVSLERGVTELVVSGNVDLSTTPFVRLRDRRQAAIESVAVVLDAEGDVVATLPTQRTTMDLGDADYERLLREGLPYQNAVSIAPGRYQVRLAAREDATGLLGSAWQWVEVPDLAPGRLALSSLFLLKEAGASRASGAADAGPALQNAQARRRFGRGESLYAQIYAYDPKRDAAGASDLVSQAQVLRDGQLLGTAAPETVEEAEPGGPPLSHTSRIKLQHFEPGDYELRVTVTDRKASAMVTRRVGFTVE